MKQSLTDLRITKKEEAKLLALIRKIQDGELRIIINDGKPIRIEQLYKDTDL